ncbi:MAG: glycoside hydrolase family 13 protein [Clostridia bacterium]
MVLFDPKNEKHKTPFGGCSIGERVVFHFHVKKAFCAREVHLVVRQDGKTDQRKIMMQHTGTQGQYEVHAGVFIPEKPGLYFYRFEILRGEAFHFCGKSMSNGMAAIGDWLPEWQLTAYQSDFTTPDWFGQGVVYQIFTDRFFGSGAPPGEDVLRGRVLREDWGGIPHYERDASGDMATDDFFGGNLKGIQEKLDHLVSLGVTCIYLNPIFEAYTNHKYDTADYLSIDPMFGDKDIFRELCTQARRKGIRIILDGVFSHTGSDSIYFNKKGTYGEGGAFQSKDSPYYEWYNFTEWPHAYESWWGVSILPAVREHTPSFLRFITGEDGVLRHWMKNGASGWRLDVADELPDVFLDHLRTAVKTEDGDGVIIGEVWEDASNKESYGKRRRYLLGSQLDSVMNYPFREAIIGFVQSGDASLFGKRIMDVLEHYPKPAVKCLMNIIGTHDTVRILTALSPVNQAGMDIREQAKHRMDGDALTQAIQSMKLASALQFTLPGVPCLYYGDEAGMQGYGDPLNRGCYPWGKENKELLEWYRRLGWIRKEHPGDFSESMTVHHAEKGLILYSRGAKFTVAVNAGHKPEMIVLAPGKHVDLMTGQPVENGQILEGRSCLLMKAGI